MPSTPTVTIGRPSRTGSAAGRAEPGTPTPPAAANARPVRLKRGAQPTHTSLTAFQRWSWKTFRARVLAKPPDPTLEENLLKAHLRIRADEYMATCYGTTLVAGVVLSVVGAVFYLLFSASGLGIIAPLIGLALPVAGTPLVFAMMPGRPGSVAKGRGRKIDRKISAAMSFVSAMSSADVNVDQIFKELARQKIYGEVAEEAAWITRDTELLGFDILTALRNGAQRSPSKRFQDFLQGVVTTATSGGQLKPYFLLKAEQYEQENKLEMLARVETLGLLAETFVTVVVAFPLFLVIIIAIFSVIGGGGSFMIDILWVLVGLMIPMMQFGFIFFMYSLTQDMV
ncbi:MAG: type II secretion system F family protein [Thermoplasmata archaeon]|nr:type II secretion system F family protein [Thermoplasmata archaeon]